MDEPVEKLLSRYEYAKNVPLRGLEINGRPALTGINPAQIGDYVILTVRDPLCAYDDDPAAQIAALMTDSHLVAQTGMFTTYSGTYEGARISVVSGGSGSPEAELVLFEFMEHTSANTYIRIGGSGGMNAKVHPGDLVIAQGVVRDEGMTQAYIAPSYPAASSYEVVMALTQAAMVEKARFHVGIIRSADSDIVGGGRPSVGGYLQPRHTEVVDYYARAGVLNGDRESAAVVTLAALFGKRGGSVCSVADNIVTGEKFEAGAGHNHAIRVGLRGLAILHQMDEEKKRAGQDFWTPSLRQPAR
jgi:uridine phosphorylase